MRRDPIVEEIHRIRKKMLEECGGDLERYFDQLQADEEKDRERLVSSIAGGKRPPARPKEARSMGHDTTELKLPEFTTDAGGKPIAVKLDTAGYVALLVRANVTDAELWPPGMRKGAEALARVRQIEADCIAHDGEFDWEKLPEDIQDEYDGLCAVIDQLQDTGERVALAG